MRLYEVKRGDSRFDRFDVRSPSVDRIFVLDSEYAERAAPKSVGFWFSGTARTWWTTRPHIAAKLLGIADMDPALAAAINAVKADRDETLAMSRAAESDLAVPAPAGQVYRPFQLAGIAFALKRGRVLIGDEPGLGKTIQALGLINAVPEIKRVLVICPASIKINWRREAEKWLVRQMRIIIADGDQCDVTADMVIVNYDVVHRHAAALRQIEWDLLVVDEVHRLKTQKARRSRYIFGYEQRRDKAGNVVKNEPEAVEPIRANRVAVLTGTPIPNRPIELFSVLHYLDPAGWASWFGYAKRYAGATQTQYGWKFDGASNLEELQERLRTTVMIRRQKAQVLTELPPKERQLIVIPANGLAGVIAHEREVIGRRDREIDDIEGQRDLAEAIGDRSAYGHAVYRLRVARGLAFEEMSRLAHETALAKVPYVIDHVEGLLESTAKVVVMAHHHDVIDAFAAGLAEFRPVKLTGDETLNQRQAAVDAFQGDPAVRVFIGSIQAAGLGLTLTAASTVVFAELDWVPGNMTQAEDRCHRIGQTDSVLAQHLVLDGSIDARRAEVLIEKQRIADEALDRQAAPEQPVAVTSSRTPALPKYTDAEMAAAGACLRLLATSDPDRAAYRNGIGFNGADGSFGHILAALPTFTPRQMQVAVRMLKKYHRQIADGLGPEPLAAIYGMDDELVKRYAGADDDGSDRMSDSPPAVAHDA